jgi:HD-GYP domain-containing protein (c-di-GMP phosphodiesterase class II)
MAGGRAGVKANGRVPREAIVKRRIRVRGINGEIEGKSWESQTLLRVGRLESLEIALDDTSVSRRHAEIRATERGWQLQDQGSTNGTFLNGIRLTEGECRLQARDIIQFGAKVTVLVELVEDNVPRPRDKRPADPLLVEKTTSVAWEEAVQGIAFDRNQCLRSEDQLQILLRASHHLGHLQSEKELLSSILEDAVRTLDAQRGAIVLAEPNGDLQLRALATGKGDPASRTTFSQSLAQRSFTGGESILCCSVDADPELAAAQSIHDGAMASIVCVLLRTPRRRLGVLHLDRSYWQKPFTEDDLHLADALAASVSAGIESAQLLRQQKQLFRNTIKVLAQAVEMRDDYTGKHTDRVTRYSHLIAQQLNLSEEDLELIEIGTPLHDIGKIGIDDAILRKPGKLTPEEFEEMKTHTTKGAKILETIPDLAPAIPIVRSHHEQWAGAGYPDGLAGEAIPRLARIVAVADAFDAMTSDRPYRKGMSTEVAFGEIRKHSGRQFDPECAATFLAMRARIEQERQHANQSPDDPTLVPGAASPITITRIPKEKTVL